MKRALILPAIFLAACCTQPPPLPAPPPEPAEAVTVTGSGVEDIGGKIPFILPAIERAFPGFIIVANEEDGIPVFGVREPGSETDLFRLEPDWSRGFIGTVTVLVPSDTGTVELQPNATPITDLPADVAQACKPEQPRPNDDQSCEVPLSTGTLILNFPAARSTRKLNSASYVPNPPAP